MAIWLFLATLLAASAALFFGWRAARIPLAWIAIAVGVSVFAIRLIQPGDYAIPSGGNLISGTLALGLGALLLILARPPAQSPSVLASKVNPERGGPRVWLQRLLLAASPIVLFLALYSTLAELEEVVVLHTTHIDGHPVDLRLWIVEDAGAGWIQMPIAKANDHGLDETQLAMTREGTRSCVDVLRFTDIENTRRVHHLRHAKYLVQRLATRIGVFTQEPTGNAAVLRITDCEAP